MGHQGMAILTKESIKNLIKLSRIDCTEEEQDALLLDLEKILGLFNQLDEVDTENVSPCNQVIEGMANVMREDTVGNVMPREVFLSNAPSQIGGMIRVPPVMKSS
jgi:aspartyl-tRNA(Asn)/glutamyl-tRNA(Gln) amidotransferase subunit C